MPSHPLELITQTLEDNTYTSPANVVSTVSQLLDIFKPELNAVNSKELIALTKKKIEETLQNKSGSLSTTLDTINLYTNENQRTQVVSFSIRNNKVRAELAELLDSPEDLAKFEEMFASLDQGYYA